MWLRQELYLKEKAIVPGRTVIYCKAHGLMNMATGWKIRSDLYPMTHHIHSCSRASPEKNSIIPVAWQGHLILPVWPVFLTPSQVHTAVDSKWMGDSLLGFILGQLVCSIHFCLFPWSLLFPLGYWIWKQNNPVPCKVFPLYLSQPQIASCFPPQIEIC